MSLPNAHLQAQLRLLLEANGCTLTAPVQIELAGRPGVEKFVPQDPSLRGEYALQAEREVQPVTLTITMQMNVPGKWHHVSGDDRHLNPFLKD